ncbi:MAG: hypothetical protein IPP46_09625 [Bacteroidetes bacterium]|nr:hypothetical protein [Bacteroidota bacterium]
MVTSLYIDNHAALWIGTNGGGAYRYTATAGANDCIQNSCKHDLNQPGDIRSHHSSLTPFSHTIPKPTVFVITLYNRSQEIRRKYLVRKSIWGSRQIRWKILYYVQYFQWSHQ